MSERLTHPQLVDATEFDAVDYLAAFRITQWLHAAFQLVESARLMGTREAIADLLINNPDEFFRPPYANLYELWCAEDHQAAKQLDVRHEEEVRELSRDAYMATWRYLNQSEVCALVSDDVRTIGALLIMNKGQLRPFTFERLNWFVRGRVPWGYEGEFPSGNWIVI